MLTLAATLAVFAYGLNSALLGALLPIYPLTPGQRGYVGLANALGLMLSSMPAGRLVDYKGKKPALLLGLGLIFAGLSAASNANQYISLLLIYFVLGLGGGIVTTGANALVSSIAPQRRGEALNFLNLFFGLGGVLTTFAASYILTAQQLCYAIASNAALAWLVSALVTMPAHSPSAASRPNDLLQLVAQPRLIIFSLLLFFYVACEVGVWNWLKSYLIISAGFSSSSAGGLVSYGFALGMLLGRLAASRIPPRFPGTSILLTAGVLISVTTFATLHLHSTIALTIAVFSTGLAMAPVFPTTLALIGDAFPRGAATAMGIAITSGWLGLAVSSPIIGHIAAISSLQQALLLLPACSTAMVLVTAVLLPTPRITTSP
jgi:fucose permease